MDGVDVESAITRDRIRAALSRYENKPVDRFENGTVRAVNADGSYEVLLDGDVQPRTCSAYATAGVGDRVLVCIMANGRCVAVSRLEGTNAIFSKPVTVRGALHIAYTGGIGADTDDYAPLIIGEKAGRHIAIDGNDIVSRSGNAFDRLYLNGWGGDVLINGCLMAQNKVLWSGGHYMAASYTATLSEAVSKQSNGVVFAWSAYNDSEAVNSDWSYFFVPKHHVSAHGHTGIAMGNISSWPLHMAKYLYVGDTVVAGHARNAQDATEIDGITIRNTSHVLRYIIGV